MDPAPLSKRFNFDGIIPRLEGTVNRVLRIPGKFVESVEENRYKRGDFYGIVLHTPEGGFVEKGDKPYNNWSLEYWTGSRPICAAVLWMF